MGKIKKFIDKIKSNEERKILIVSSFSFTINVAFLVYNLVFGIIYKTVWNWSITAYYALLIVFRAVIITNEKKWGKLQIEDLDAKRLSLFKIVCWCMIVMDLSLIAPITLMALLKRIVNIGMIPTLAIATYTVYKITLAIINYSKTENSTLSVKALRLITLKDAIVSILTLQNTMIMVFGNGVSMLTLTAISSAGLLVVLLFITVTAIIKAYTLSKKN